jgi:hypothetical protein
VVYRSSSRLWFWYRHLFGDTCHGIGFRGRHLVDPDLEFIGLWSLEHRDEFYGKHWSAWGGDVGISFRDDFYHDTDLYLECCVNLHLVLSLGQ